MTHAGWGEEWSGVSVPDPAKTRRSAADRHRSARRRRRRTRRRALIVGAVVVALLLGAVVWLGMDAMRARSELDSAAGLVRTLQDQVLAGDREAAVTTLTALQDHAHAADDAAHGPHWSAARAMPWIGPNVSAVQTVAEVVDDLATDALPGLMDATDLVDPASLAPVDGRVDLEPLRAATPPVVSADAAVRAAAGRIGAIETEPLLDLVAGPVTDFDAQIQDVAMTTATAAKAVQLLPAMLGTDGPREYLLLVQNNAEPRATGGIPGAVILLRADDGAVEVVEQRSGGSLGDLAEPVLPLTRTEQALFGEDLAADMRDVTFTPDFPRTGEIAREIWAQEVGGELDGVLSVDPGTLALLLDATGPLPLPPGPVAEAAGGSLTADNAVELLLNTVYLVEEDPQAHDAFFAATAGIVFAAVVGGQGEPAATVEALAESARQGRLMIWSVHEEEQNLLSGTVLSGELRGVRGESPVIGVFLNDGSQAKMGYYLDTAITAESTECRSDGSQLVTVTVTLTNTVPADVASRVSYITGQGDVVPVGEVRTNVLLYAPSGGYVDEIQMRGAEPGVTSQIHDGLPVVGKTLQLAPGESATVIYDVVSEIGQIAPPAIRSTPLPLSETSVTPVSTCS